MTPQGGSQIKVVVCGALGRMGQMVMRAVLGRPDLLLAGAVERKEHPSLGQNIGPLVGPADLNLVLTDSLAEAAKGADVCIDFSSIEATLEHLGQAEELGLALVIGTTGLDAAQQQRLRAAGRKIPVLWAPNMSTGVNVMYKVAAALAKMLGPDFDLEIVESHHNQKKDAPSGTAVKLFEVLAEARGLDPEKAMVAGRRGQVGARTKEEIGVLALRGGDIVGEHTVYFCGPGERLELTHRAASRNTFAEGAVRAAAWLAGKPAGFYGIDDTISGE